MEEDVAIHRRPKRLGPPHLRIVEVDFLKPTMRNESESTPEEAEKLMGGALVGDWE
jgi:hypothetical protein